MPPRLPLRRHSHNKNIDYVTKSWSSHDLQRTSVRSESTETSANTSASTNPSPGPYARDERQTWRMSADGKRKLPLPPILDPIAISQRDRWIEPKKPAAAPAEQTPFQKKLSNNAFAHMLSTPIREDRKLGLSLPTHYLIPIRPVKHPSTDDIWLLPQTTLKPTKAAGSFNSWALGRQAHLRALNSTKRGGAWRGLTAPEQTELMMGQSQGDSGGSGKRASAVWRADMDELVLRLLREQVVQQLRYGFGRPRGGGVVARLWDEPGKGFEPYRGAAAENETENETEAASPNRTTRRSLTSQLSQHPAPAALLFLRPLTPLSAQAADAVAQQIATCNGLVDRLVKQKRNILQKFYPDYSPGPHSRWAYADHVYPRLVPRLRFGRLRPSVVRWTPSSESKEMAEEEEEEEEEAAAAAEETPRAGEQQQQHSHLVPVYSLPDLLGGDEAVGALLGGEQGERLWGRDAVLLKAGPGAIGALLALERLRCYVEVPW